MDLKERAAQLVRDRRPFVHATVVRAQPPTSSHTGDEAILLQEGFHVDELESALESALDQSAEVVVVRHHPDLEALGSIAAVLRYSKESARFARAPS